MREVVSRRKVLSLLGAASALTLSGALGPSEAGAETTGTAGMKSHRARRTSRHQRPTVQPASAPAEAAPLEFKPTNSASQLQMSPPSAGRPPLHSGD
jgi:hypothetical protein